MSLFRYAQDVYGQETLLGASWDLIKWFAIAGAAFIVLDIAFKLIARKEPEKPRALSGDPRTRLVRHLPIDRLYHWLMAISVVTLLVTAFGPHLGWRFNWLTIHWIAGVILTLLVCFHIVRALVWQDFWAMTPDLTDLRDAWRASVKWLVRKSPAPGLPGKYPLLQKAYHWGIAALALTLIGTGLLMLTKIDTPFWRRNPYWLSSRTWGIIYTTHDLCAMFLLTFIMIHIYFALRPDKLWTLRSMIFGWMTRGDYALHHDSRRWPVPEPAAQEGSGPKGDASSIVSSL